MLHLKYWKSVLLASVILVLCLVPSQNLEKIDFLHINFQDLLVHLVMFLAFSFLLAHDLIKNKALKNNRRHQIIFAVSVSFLFAVLTEMLQLILPSLNRSGSLGDLLFDLAGIALGIFVAYVIKP